MFATALIVFREVLEVALIVGIVLAATRGIARREIWIGAGIVSGLLFAGVLALLAGSISQAAFGVGQELLNALILFSAVAMLAWHNIWMSRHGTQVAREMNRVGRAVLSGQRPLYVLAVIAGLATLREGAEVVLFLSGIAASGTDRIGLLSGGVIGVTAGAATGLLLYLGLLRIPLRHLFSVCSWMILLLAAGMASQGASYLVQADMLPTLGDSLWDTSWVLSEQSLAGQILHILVGYVSRPSGIQIVFYLATLMLVGVLMWMFKRRPVHIGAAVPAAVVGVLAGFVLMANPDDALATHKIYSPTVEKGEVELEIRGHTTRDNDTALDGEQKTKYEIGVGVTDRWFSAIFVELEKEPGSGETKHSATAWENIIQLTEQGRYWLDAGLYLEYEAAKEKGAADKIETKVLLEKPVNRFLNTTNLVLAREVGSNRKAGTDFEAAWRTKYRWKKTLEPAIEIYWAPGTIDHFKNSSEQELSLGPVLTGEFGGGKTGKFVYEIGYLRGLNKATPRETWKWLIEYEFSFGH